MTMYRNVDIDGWRWLIVEIAGRTYLLGRTGRVGHCQDHARMARTSGE
jgi:hypothetical protein